MQKLALGLTTLLVILIVAAVPPGRMGKSEGIATPKDDLQPMTIRGDIWDSRCAAAGSHGKMMANIHAKDVVECTLNCVKAGAEFVLYNTDDKTIFRLDSQDKVREYAGQKVTVSGNYDRATGILHLESINSVS
ncbi:MAG: DUF5818 domain-containing protein [Terriglobia bacterium]|jgi:hypothetical protein